MSKFRKRETIKKVNTAKRIYILGSVFACMFGLLFCRALYFHMKDNGEVERVALRQYRTAVTQSTKRGKILDSMKRELAIDTTVESIYANPREIEDSVSAADKLSRLLNVNRRKLLEKISSNRKFIWVKRGAKDSEAKAVMNLGMKGLYSMRESSRSYPGKTLASSILGAVGFDAAPLGGIESSYNSYLSATASTDDVKRDARGHLYLSPGSSSSEEPQVANVELTIDRTLEYVAEQSLEKAVTRAHAKGGSVVVVDVTNGAILAMANMPTFDPNSYGEFSAASWRNRAITDAYEPGSTFKTIIVTAALDRGLVTPNDVLDCEGGSIRIGNKVVHDAHPHGKLSVADIIKVSSNIGAYKVEQKLGYEKAYEAIRSFGFGRQTGIDLPGESPGLLVPSNHWSEIQFATIAFGQGIAVTPLQMANAFAAIANGGTLYKPYIVKRILSANGDVVYEGTKRVAGNPVGEASARTMAELLMRVVQRGGTGTQAASSEYKVAGKTGTAQKADPRSGGYAPGKYYSSFVGFAPADAPRISVYVGIDEPSGGMYYGGQVAAPVFREVVDATLNYLRVPGKTITASQDEDQPSVGKVQIEELATVEPAEGGIRQVTQNDDMTWRIPDLKGLTMRGVLDAVGSAEISLKFVGSGIAVSQAPAAGSTVPMGALCTVEFKSMM